MSIFSLVRLAYVWENLLLEHNLMEFFASLLPSLKDVSLCLGVAWGSLGRICSLLDKTASCLRFGSALLIRKQDEVVPLIAHRIQSHTKELLRQETCSLDGTSWALSSAPPGSRGRTQTF